MMLRWSAASARVGRVSLSLLSVSRLPLSDGDAGCCRRFLSSSPSSSSPSSSDPYNYYLGRVTNATDTKLGRFTTSRSLSSTASIDEGAAYSGIEAALDSVVKIFTVSSSPNYLLPWQNKPPRETWGSGGYPSSCCCSTIVVPRI